MPPQIFPWIQKRRSIKAYSDKQVPNALLLRILTAGCWAPSAHNSQPWRFIVIQDATQINKLAEEMANHWNQDMIRDGIPPEQRENRVSHSIHQFTNAPLVIIVCLTPEDLDEYLDQQRKEAEYFMAIQSVAAAIENILLTAHAEGLGACWFCAPLFCQDTVRKILKIPDKVYPQALITLGYPTHIPPSPPRRPLDEVVYRDYWGNAI